MQEQGTRGEGAEKDYAAGYSTRSIPVYQAFNPCQMPISQRLSQIASFDHADYSMIDPWIEAEEAVTALRYLPGS